MVFGWFSGKKAKPDEEPEDVNRVRVKTIYDEPCFDINDTTKVCYFDPFTLAQRKKDMSVCSLFKEEREAVLRGDVPVVGPSLNSPADEEPASPEDDPEIPADAPVGDWNEDAAKEVEAKAEAAAIEDDGEDPALIAARVANDDTALQALIDKEKLLTEELRVAVQLEYPDPSSDPLNQKKFKLQLDLLRFLRARKYNVAKAAKMWQACEEWRATKGMDTVLSKPDPNWKMFQCKCPHTNHGVGYEGHPVYIERTGMVRVNEMLKIVTDDDVVDRHLRYMEYNADRMAVHSQIHGRNITKGIMIHDLAHVRYAVETSGVKIFKKTVTVDQNFYPERLHHAFIINAPLSLRAAWAAVQPLLDANTSRKIEILGPNFKDRLLEFIPPSQLPRHYGGLCECFHENGDSCLPHLRDFQSATDAEAPKDWLPIIYRTPEQQEEVQARRKAEEEFRSSLEASRNVAASAATASE